MDFSCTDESVNRILYRAQMRGSVPGNHSACRYNQNEDQFLLLGTPIEVPALPVHHPIDVRVPPEGYTAVIGKIADFLVRECPTLVAGTRWFFDPLDIHAPQFWRIEQYEGQLYLYTLMVDLTCRPLESEITEGGTNFRTHAYRTNHLYFECDWFPLFGSTADTATLLQTIPITWRGESGQGYMLHGIWMDSDINKFFSKLILPAGKRNHPYYPITCKQHCVTMNAFGQAGPGGLHRIRGLIEPALYPILKDLQSAPFSELMPLFVGLKKKVPIELGSRWKDLSVRTILNEREQKEYIVEF